MASGANGVLEKMVEGRNRQSNTFWKDVEDWRNGGVFWKKEQGGLLEGEQVIGKQDCYLPEMCGRMWEEW